MTATSEVHIASPSYGCSAQDRTLAWSQLMLDSSAYSLTWGQYLGGADAANVLADFNTTLSNGTGWAVSQDNYQAYSSNGGGGAFLDDTVNIQFSPSATAYVDFGTIGSHTYAYMRTTDGGYVYDVRLSYYKPSSGPDAGKCLPVVNQTARWTGDADITWINNNLGAPNFSIASDWQSGSSGFVTTANPLFIKADVHYPSNYEGATISSVVPLAHYVAMGDSFSSGEGNPPFEDGTDTSSDACHRSPQAYPHLLDNDSSLNLGSMAFVACSGAGTVDVVNGKNGEPSQLNAISADTTLITVTAGGDDVGFPDYATGCLNPSPCGPGTTAYDTMIDRVSSPQLVVRLETMYNAILAQATNPDAQVYVVDYPYLAPQGASSCGGFDMSGAHSIQNVLNAAIAQAVADMHNSKLHYVSTNVSGSPFEGKDMCSGAPDFNGFDPVHWGYSLHPNIYGQVDYAAVVKAVILANS